jgi:hypothetical protein
MTENEINKLRIGDLVLFTSIGPNERKSYIIYQIEDIDFDSEPIWIDTLTLYQSKYVPYSNGFLLVEEDLPSCLSLILPGELDIIINRHKLVKWGKGEVEKPKPTMVTTPENIISDFDKLFNQY